MNPTTKRALELCSAAVAHAQMDLAMLVGESLTPEALEAMSRMLRIQVEWLSIMADDFGNASKEYAALPPVVQTVISSGAALHIPYMSEILGLMRNMADGAGMYGFKV